MTGPLRLHLICPREPAVVVESVLSSDWFTALVLLIGGFVVQPLLACFFTALTVSAIPSSLKPNLAILGFLASLGTLFILFATLIAYLLDRLGL